MNWLYQITQYASGAALPANSAHCQRNWLYMSRVVLATYSAHCCSTLLCIQYVRGRTVKKKRTLSRNWLYHTYLYLSGAIQSANSAHCQWWAVSNYSGVALSTKCSLCPEISCIRLLCIRQGPYCQQITLALSKIGCITLLCICQGPYVLYVYTVERTVQALAVYVKSHTVNK